MASGLMYLMPALKSPMFTKLNKGILTHVFAFPDLRGPVDLYRDEGLGSDHIFARTPFPRKNPPVWCHDRHFVTDWV